MTHNEQEFQEELRELTNLVQDRTAENNLLRSIEEAKVTLRVNLSEGRVTDPSLLDSLRDSIETKTTSLEEKVGKIKRRRKSGKPVGS